MGSADMVRLEDLRTGQSLTGRKHVLSILVENRPGVLARVAGLFSRRGFNIDTLAVGPTERPDRSVITIRVDCTRHSVEQVVKQLYKLIDVIDDVPRSDLKPKEADDIVERIDDLVAAASRDARDTDAQLRETAEAIARKVSDEASRDRAEELLIALADVLGIPEATVTRAFEREP